MLDDCSIDFILGLGEEIEDSAFISFFLLGGELLPWCFLPGPVLPHDSSYDYDYHNTHHPAIHPPNPHQKQTHTQTHTHTTCTIHNVMSHHPDAATPAQQTPMDITSPTTALHVAMSHSHLNLTVV